MRETYGAQLHPGVDRALEEMRAAGVQLTTTAELLEGVNRSD